MRQGPNSLARLGSKLGSYTLLAMYEEEEYGRHLNLI